jgi:hypothetical protein
MRTIISVLAAWYFILGTNGQYSTQGPFPDKQACQATAATLTTFCRHGTLSMPQGSHRQVDKHGEVHFLDDQNHQVLLLCMGGENTTVEKPCWEVK